MQRVFRPIVIGLFMIFVVGCAKTELISDVDPRVDMSDMKTFHVVKFKNDGRGIERIIENELKEMGFEATSGVVSKPEKSVSAIVEYQDKWMWDITMYMLELNIDFRDPETNYKFASGRSYRTSLVRKSPEEMVEEVLTDIFNKSNGVSQ